MISLFYHDINCATRVYNFFFYRGKDKVAKLAKMAAATDKEREKLELQPQAHGNSNNVQHDNN